MILLAQPDTQEMFIERIYSSTFIGQPDRQFNIVWMVSSD
jgi:hypothetical protein